MTSGENPPTRTGRLSFQGPWVADYVIREVPDARRAVVLLHGYTQSYHAMFPKFDPLLPRDCTVLALNGPFPMPEKLAQGGYRVGYSWYFYDDSRDEYFIDMSIALGFVEAALKEVGLADAPKTLIGFSQGGYLAPFLGERLRGVDQVIGVGARFLEEEIRGTPAFRLDAIHGELDEIVRITASLESWQRLKDRGAAGEFRTIAGLGHRLSGEAARVAVEMVSRAAPGADQTPS